MKKNTKGRLLREVTSIADLAHEAKSNPRYAKLAKLASANLGGPSDDLKKAIQWLKVNAAETDEDGIIGEINFCRDLVDEE